MGVFDALYNLISGIFTALGAITQLPAFISRGAYLLTSTASQVAFLDYIGPIFAALIILPIAFVVIDLIRDIF